MRDPCLKPSTVLVQPKPNRKCGVYPIGIGFPTSQPQNGTTAPSPMRTTHISTCGLLYIITILLL